MDREERAKELWQYYKNGQDYFTSTNLSENIPRWVDYYQGKQWGEIAEGTEQMPRVVFNFTKLICRNKKSNILSTPCRIIFKSESNPQLATKLTNFYRYWEKEAKIGDLDSLALDDATQIGTYIYHTYWDKDAPNRIGEEKGALRDEIIDPLNFIVANPLEEDVQKQKWVMIVSRVELDAVKGMADKGVDVSLLKPDKDKNAYNDTEQNGTELCTLLTRYFRKGGAVYCEVSTQQMLVREEFPLTPIVEDVEEEDSANVGVNDKGISTRYEATLYPITCGKYERKRNCQYGQGEVEGLISVQDTINIVASMNALSVMDDAWQKTIVKPDALRGQEITNEVGQVLVDYSKDGEGIKRLPSSGINTAPLNILDSYVSMLRNTSGANEVLSGEIIGSNMSGSAIAQLQAQANQPIEELRNRFWRVKQEHARVVLQFFKLSYVDKTFTYVDEKVDKDNVIEDTFNSEEIKNLDFDVQVQASGGTRSSTAGDIVFLDNLLKMQAITPLQYAEMYPNDAIENKEEIIKVLKESEMQENMVLKQKLAQYEQQMTQASKLLAEEGKVVQQVESVVQDNNRLRAEYIALYNESLTKIMQANQMASQYGEVYGDAQAMAMALKDQVNNASE